MKKDVFSKHIQAADFRTLFNELGWDHKPLARTLNAADNAFSLQAVAEKRDFYVLQCSPDTNGKIPDQNARRAISRQFEKVKNYHVLIFANRDGSEQVWQFVLRLPNRPPKFIETRWQRGQDVELLYQKVRGLFFDLDEEGNITIVDVLTRVQDAAGANAEKVTKKFYEGFKKEHSAFLGFIKGIKAQGDQEWYASLMLNRLMFCYFIQKKRFLDNNPHYLSDKLREVREQQGKGVFYNFYREFLLVLFHEGLNKKGDKPALIGQVPYLNGGLFDVHELEDRYPEIAIPDEAFERIFAFFDQYEWHLDNRSGRTGNEINPDVIGYIFEKYINDRADMGAYYTKEDITDYISKNCIIPFLFDESERKGAQLKPAFQLLADDPDRYIYPAVRHGISFDYRRNEPLEQPVPLPEDVAAGLDTDQPNLLERRKCWNREAPPEAGLPTEWWRETVERRQRYDSLRAKMSGGEVQNINDLITLNLDIRLFAQDALRMSEDPQFVRHFFAALEGLSVLDPTCGSGAFLFAALNILEPLYEICLDRMADFVNSLPVGEGRGGVFKDFEKNLAEANDLERHPNRDYFIYKRIIVHNLYGVDIMREAVEIAKLRLFLKLMSTVEADRLRPNLGLEPLPDVDFNLRSGNSLVGFATFGEAEDAIRKRDTAHGQTAFVFDTDLEVLAAVREKSELVSRAFARFQDGQVVTDQGSNAHRNAKSELRKRLADLNDALNTYNAFLYGIDREKKKADYEQWLEKHQPFHWFAEFYEIVNDRGGFDCVIGNPPYVEYSKVRKNYTLLDYSTIDAGNLYAFICERSNKISTQKSSLGFIIPISVVSIEDFESLRNLELHSKNSLYLSHFAIRPAKLFNGVEQRLTILISSKWRRSIRNINSTKYHQWYTDERNFLFDGVQYRDNQVNASGFPKAKVGNMLSSSIVQKVIAQKNNSVQNWLQKSSKYPIYFHRTPGYWIRMMNFSPFFKSPTADKSIHHIRELYFDTEHHANFVGAIVNSSLYFFYFFAMGNCRNLTYDDILLFTIGKPEPSILESTNALFKDLMKNFQENSFINHRGETEFQEFNWGLSKPILDAIDTLLASHYGFTPEELDFIINYDIKYRMGRGSGEEA